MRRGELSEFKKKILLFFYVVILVIFLTYSLRYKIKSIFNNIFPPSTITDINMTAKEKSEDFNQLYDTLIESVPMIDEYQNLYGVDFRSRKKFYEEQIENTHDDFEFYCTMKAIIKDIPSFHTDLLFPMDYNINCYNSKSISTDRSVISYGKYFEKQIEKNKNDNRDMNFSCFSYVDGKYLFDKCGSYGNFNSELKQSDFWELYEINDMSADEFIKNNLSVFKFHYDFGYNKVFKYKIIFNDKDGIPVKITVKGEKKDIEMDLYYSVSSQIIYSELKYENEDTDTSETIYENNVFSYIRIDSMHGGTEIEKQLSNLKNNNIILDLRNNYGGNPQFAAEYIYPVLYSSSFTENNYWYMPVSKSNKLITSDLYNKLVLKLKETTLSPFSAQESYLKGVRKTEYTGKSRQTKNVYILVSDATGSAADRFVSDLKSNNLATVIGTNTGGEGLMQSYCCTKLDNSKLAFIYMPGGAKNPDGTDNSVCGTSPDIYKELSTEDFIKHQKENIESIDYMGYKDRINYDTVLKACVEKIMEKNK